MRSVHVLLQSLRVIALIIVSLFLLWVLQQSHRGTTLGLLRNMPQSDLRRTVEGFNLRERSRHHPLRFDGAVWGAYAERRDLCALAQAQTWLAGTQDQQLLDVPLTSWPFTTHSVLDGTHRVVWRNLPSSSGLEELDACWEENRKIVPDLIASAVSMLLGFTSPLVTPATPISARWVQLLGATLRTR